MQNVVDSLVALVMEHPKPLQALKMLNEGLEFMVEAKPKWGAFGPNRLPTGLFITEYCRQKQSKLHLCCRIGLEDLIFDIYLRETDEVGAIVSEVHLRRNYADSTWRVGPTSTVQTYGVQRSPSTLVAFVMRHLPTSEQETVLEHGLYGYLKQILCKNGGTES